MWASERSAGGSAYQALGPDSKLTTKPSAASKASPMANDPYSMAKEVALNTVQKLQSDVANWSDILETTNTSTSTAFGKATSKCKHGIKSLERHIKSIERTVSIVEANRGDPRFASIDDEELGSRRRFVNETRAKLEQCKSELHSRRAKDKMERDRKELLNPSKTTGLRREIEHENTDFVASQAQRQELAVEEQDVILDDMAHALKRLGAIGETITVHLKEDNRLLGEIDDEIDHVQSRFDLVMGKMQKLMGTSNNKLIFVVFLLIVVVVILGYFAFF